MVLQFYPGNNEPLYIILHANNVIIILCIQRIIKDQTLNFADVTAYIGYGLPRVLSIQFLIFDDFIVLIARVRSI